MSSNPSHPVAGARADANGALGRGVWAGAAPLILLIVVVALTLVGDALARTLAFPVGFLTWRWIVAGVLVGGLIVAAVVYIVATSRALRRASLWQRAGLAGQAAAVYWTLLVAALVVLLPVIIALAAPQHPAPPRAP